MRVLARQASQTPEVRSLALELESPQNLDRWFRRYWKPVPDPPDAEWITTPLRHLQWYWNVAMMAGDCDDAATLGAAIALAAGWPAEFVAIRNLAESEFSHVFLRAGGMDIDPIVPESEMPIQGLFETIQMEV